VIDIRLSLITQGNLQLQVNGHAGSGPKGFDIVCAAVSSLVLTLLGGLESETEAVIEGNVGEGCCDVTVKSSPSQAEKFDLVVRVFHYGLNRLAQAYPKMINFHSAMKGE